MFHKRILVMVNRNLVRDQVYDYLREQMGKGILKPGSIIEKKNIMKELGISQTPLREAFLQLQADGFVTILPQRGVEINSLTWSDIRDIYEIVGSLESRIIKTVFPKIGLNTIKRMKNVNEKMNSAFLKNDNHKYNMYNIQFHNEYLDLSENLRMVNIIKKQRQVMFDFPLKNYGVDWKEENYNEHLQLIELIKSGDAEKAAHFIKEVHLSLKSKYLATTE